MKYPSPAQARALRYLAANESIRVHVNLLHRRARFIGRDLPAYDFIPGRGQDGPGFIVFDALIKHQWLEVLNSHEAFLLDQYFSAEREAYYRLSYRGKLILAKLKPHHFESPEKKTRTGPTDAELTAQIQAALRGRYEGRRDHFGYPPQWCYFEELTLSSGFASQRIDGWAINCYPSSFQIKGFEIKTGRGDLLKELKSPNKRAFAMAVCSHFYFVTPKGLMRPGELPEGCGLIEWTGRVLRTVEKAPERKMEDNLDVFFVAALVRRLNDFVEERMQRATTKLQAERDEAVKQKHQAENELSTFKRDHAQVPA